MRLNPVARGLRVLPVRAARRGQERAPAARGVDVVDFGVGEPREETPAVHPRARSPTRSSRCRPTRRRRGCRSCATAIAAWVGRRFGAALDPDTEVVPTLGSKEAIFHLAQVVGPANVVA